MQQGCRCTCFEFHAPKHLVQIELAASANGVTLCYCPWQDKLPPERPLCFVRMLNVRLQCAPTCSLLASKCQVIVTGHVVPLAPFVPDHHHTIFSWLEEAVRLVWPPVVKLLWENMLLFPVWMLLDTFKLTNRWQMISLINKWSLFNSSYRLQLTDTTDGGAT